MNGYTNADVINLANAIYGEGASEDYETMTMIGSSALNRLNANRPLEFGGNLQEVLQKGYYAVSNPNVPYRQALEQKFPDKNSENKWKQAVAISSGLIKGTIEPVEGQFFFTEKEKPKMNWKLLREVGKTGKYKVWTYK